MKKIIVAIALVVVSFSCNREAEKLTEEIWLVHDEVMPKMNELRLMTESIEEMPDSVLANNDSLMMIYNDLKTSDRWMMKWMQEFDDQRKEDVEYLQSEKVRVNEMKTYFNKSLEDGKAYMSNYSK